MEGFQFEMPRALAGGPFQVSSQKAQSYLQVDRELGSSAGFSMGVSDGQGGRTGALFFCTHAAKRSLHVGRPPSDVVRVVNPPSRPPGSGSITADALRCHPSQTQVRSELDPAGSGFLLK